MTGTYLPIFPHPLLLPDGHCDARKFRSKGMKATCQGWRGRKTEGAWDIGSIVVPPSSPGGLHLVFLGRKIITHSLVKLLSVWFLSSAAKVIIIDTKSKLY